MAVAIPLLAAGSAVYSASQQKNAADFNSSVMANERNAAVNQGAAQEGLVRRASAEAFGREEAAFGGAGVGYGGSSATALRQSAVNQELDALTTRYKAAFTGYGYGVESDILKRQGNEAAMGGGLLAGARALQALSGNYTLYQPDAGQQPG